MTRGPPRSSDWGGQFVILPKAVPGERHMRKILDLLYLVSGAIAATCLFLIAVTIVAQVIGRIVGVTIDSTESGGFFLAGTTFMGMAWTLKTGGHVRVTLLVSKFGPRLARAFDILVCAFAALGCAVLSRETLGMTRDSWRFGDLSPGLLAIPIWIPQSVMLTGVVILTIALIDDLVLLLRGRVPGYAMVHDTALETGE
ncbi:TRAP-type mannitol/chloroaromatic compound transport system, small permease component [Marinibacterium anthonyi]|nr:TRAP-type mannitol/chloroaromatic compound transport system, small permease component [Marinibacterium anthonyi]